MPDVLSMCNAKARGLTRYFTGVDCPRGHIAERIVSTRACAMCARERKHAWNAANPDGAAAQRRAWVAANPERVKALKSANQKKHRASANARHRKYAAAHRDELRMKKRQWERSNPAAVLARAARRRAAVLNQMPAWTDHEAIGMVYRAAHVARTSGFDVHVDHIVPLQGLEVSGLHVPANLQIIQARANRMKSNSFPAGA